jgi:hypothetical protein
MGVRIEVYLTHDLPRFDDAAAILARLESTLPGAFAVRDYWHSVDWRPIEAAHWEAEPVDPRPPAVRRYTGPGSLFLTVTPKVARVHTGGRWAGFLTIEPLRRVHVAAFREIAVAMHSPTMAICADSRDDVCDVFLAHGTQADCVAQLRSALGPPQPSVVEIAPEVAQRRDPNVWFLCGGAAAD